MKRHTWQITLMVGTQGQPRDKVVHVEREDVGAEVIVLFHAEVILPGCEAGVWRALPPATCLVTVLQLVPEVSLLAFTLVVPPVLGGSTLVGGGGAGPLGLLFRVLSRSHEKAILHEELVVGMDAKIGRAHV